MIDYIKILLKNIDVNRLLNLHFLDFKIEVSEVTGECSTKRVAEYNFCKITIYDSGIILFTGSIHKLYNSLKGIKAPNWNQVKQYKGYNGNQFTINDIFEVREHLQKIFDCELHQMIFQNIELGVNTSPKINPNLYLKGLLYHKSILFEYRCSGNFAQAPHQRFIFKIYNKSNQYGMGGHTMRVELKIIKMSELGLLGINTFGDININILDKAKELLLKRFDEVVHYDYTIKKDNLTEHQKRMLNRYSNPRYWINELKPIHRDRHKKNLLKITRGNSQNIHQKIRQNIIEKCVMINRLSEPPGCVRINHSNIGVSITQLPNKITAQKTSKKKGLKKGSFCIVTGVDISMQKEDSSLLSHTGLKHLFTSDRKKYEEIKRKHLTKKWFGFDFYIEIREIAHNIRDTKRYQEIRQKRLYPPQQVQMFELNELQLWTKK